MPTAKKKKPATKETICLRLHPSHLQRLDALAETKGTTRSALIQLAVADYLEKEKA
jgi:predicted transcriptional regulator